MKSYDWSKFTVRIPVKTDVYVIYDAWAKPAQLESWFLRRAELPDS